MTSGEIIFLVITLLTSIFGISFLIRDIMAGKTKPNLVTWFFWALAPLIGTFLQIKAGAGLSVLPVFLAGFFPVIIFVVALLKRNAHWKITVLDILCGAFSFLALMLWILTSETDISILFAILADGLAAIPTLIKSWKFPKTETALGYMPGIINNALGLLFIKNWDFSMYSFGIYFIVLNSVLIIFITRKNLLKFVPKFIRDYRVG